MKTHASGNELLVVSRRNHRLLLAQLSSTLLIVPTIAVLLYMIAYYTPNSFNLSDLSLMNWLYVFVGIIAIFFMF